VHGIPSSSDSLVLNEPDGSFPLYLADNGYDVWLINMRGNYYSRRHTEMSPNSNEFWEYDLADHLYDFQGTISYILQETGFEMLSVIGISHGSTVFLISLATEPEWFNQRVNIFIAFVPLSTLIHTTNNYFRLITNGWMLGALKMFGYNEFLPRQQFMAQLSGGV
jgi:lysosomal acid lipase/cholesteryl ester hydrolase